MESQVYRDFADSMVKPTSTTPKKTVLHLGISPDGRANTYDTTATNQTPKTCAECETGFIDLENAWQPASPTAESTSSDVEELLRSPSMQLQVESQAPGLGLPETPSLAGRKHSRNGEVLHSTATSKKTPGFSQLFGGDQKGTTLSATQLFNQTQAPSSPMPDGPRSDPIMTRPSPNLHYSLNLSSPNLPVSSPVATMHARPSSTAGEPRDTYTSMRESQERRAARFRQELREQGFLNDDIIEEDDEELDIERRRFEQKRMQRVLSDQALHDLAKVRARSRPGSRPTSSPKLPATIDLITPATARRGQPIEFDISEDGNGSEGELIPEDDVHSENDEYDELGQTVLRSQGNVDDEDSDVEADIPEKDDIDDDDEMDHNDINDHVEDEIPHNGQQARFKDIDRPHDRDPHHGTQHSAVADSQPEQQGRRQSLLPQTAVHPSSLSSFVPGSQYAGMTSQDEGRIKSQANGSSLHSRTGLSHTRPVPSSPPLQADTDTIPADSAEASAARQQLLVQFQQRVDTSNGTEHEIPESDLPDSSAQKPSLSQPTTSPSRLQMESNSLPLFSTARTHVSASGPSPGKNDFAVSPSKVFASQQTKPVSQSPRTSAGVHLFADMAKAQSPPNGSAETMIDVDALMSDVMTADDEQFIEAISSPPRDGRRKRRKLMPDTGSPPQRVLAPNVPEGPIADGPGPGHQLSGKETASVTAGLTSTALRESPRKANELRAATPPAEPSIPTPDSVRKREEAGAKAISQLVSSTPVKSTKQPKLSANDKKSARLVQQRKLADIDIQRNGAQENDQGERVDKKVVMDSNTDGDEHTVQRSSLQVIAPDRVFALFKGSFNNFYPATWLGAAPDGVSHRIRFDDNTTTTVEAQHVRRLDLRVDDTIKVDVSGLRKQVWIVKGFSPTARTMEEKAAGTDMFGRYVVKVQAKSSRTGLGDSVPAGQESSELIDVALTAVYITPTMWNHFADRTFAPPTTSKCMVSRAATPVTSLRTPEDTTPTSRLRRSIVPTTKSMTGRTSFLREESVSSATTPTGVGLFAGMAFAISYGSNEAEKANVTRLIQRSGGIVLENGFEVLFDLPSLEDSPPASPAKQSPRKAKSMAPAPDDAGLQLKPAYEGLGFVALIADKHSRRAKYVQALALGLPTLSGKWIADSLDSSKNPNAATANAAPLPWTRYLLPAGESAYLGGAIRSRTMTMYDTADAQLSHTIGNREMLLNSDGVLIVVPKKGKAVLERRKAYAFLTLALGAARVKRVTDLQEAKTLLSEDPDMWRWVYVDGPVADADATIHGKFAARGKKRKRGDDVAKVDAEVVPTNRDVRVVNDEFVVQSLILGALVD